MMIPGSFVITEPIPGGGNGVKADIVRVLQRDQIKSFRKDGIWPECFSDCIYLDNSYGDRFKRIEEETLRTRKPLCSASHYLGGTTSFTAVENPHQEEEDDMPYIPPNPNIKAARRHIMLNTDGSYEQESDEEVLLTEALSRRRGGRRRGIR